MRGGRKAYIRFFSVLLLDIQGHMGWQFVAYGKASGFSGAIFEFQPMSRIIALERDLCKGQKTENFSQLEGYLSGQRMKFKQGR